VKRYRGSRANLTRASRLVLSIADIDEHRLLLDGLQLKCDFKYRSQRLKAQLDAKLDVCSAILNSASLRQFAHLMLKVSNMLNEVPFYSEYRTGAGLTSPVASGRGLGLFSEETTNKY